MPGKRSYRAWLWAALLFASGPAVQAQASGPQFINPPGLTRPTGYTHVVVSADGRTAYVAGQVAFDSTERWWEWETSRPKPTRCSRTCDEPWRAWGHPSGM